MLFSVSFTRAWSDYTHVTLPLTLHLYFDLTSLRLFIREECFLTVFLLFFLLFHSFVLFHDIPLQLSRVQSSLSFFPAGGESFSHSSNDVTKKKREKKKGEEGEGSFPLFGVEESRRDTAETRNGSHPYFRSFFSRLATTSFTHLYIFPSPSLRDTRQPRSPNFVSFRTLFLPFATSMFVSSTLLTLAHSLSLNARSSISPTQPLCATEMLHAHLNT